MKHFSLIIILYSFFLLVCSKVHSQMLYPTPPISNQVDTFFGVTVTDPYRLMEYDSLSEISNWVSEENKLSKNYFNKLSGLTKVRRKVAEIGSYHHDGLTKSGRYYFSMYRNVDDTKNASLYFTSNKNRTPEFLLDPYDLKKEKGEIVRINNFSVSGDNHYLAFTLSRNGSDWQEARVCRMPSGKMEIDELLWLKSSDIVWQGNGFYYTRFPKPNESKIFTDTNRFPSIYYHSLNTSQTSDIKIFVDSLHANAAISMKMLGQEKYLYFEVVYKGEDGSSGYCYIKNLQEPISSSVKKIKIPFRSYTFIDEFKGQLLAKVNDSVNSLGCLQLIDPLGINEPTMFVPEIKGKTDWVLLDASIIGNKLATKYVTEGEYKYVVFDESGKAVFKIEYPLGVTIGDLETVRDSHITQIDYQSLTYPPLIYQLDVEKKEASLVSSTKINYDIKEFTVKKVYYYSKDSCKIPMIIVYKKDLKFDNNAPTLLYGYGGFGVIHTPQFNPEMIYFMQNGGIVAIPYLRGGGEKGEAWHRAGSRLNKQNTFNDFIAAAEFLFSISCTNPDKLAIIGGSNGGLLVGSVITQRPDLCKVAIGEMGVYDMLRFNKYTVGGLFEQEYGSVSDSLDFKNLYSYSPLHHVKKGVKYPATIILTADHDDRVVPMHAYKFAAALQQNTGSDNPILLYTIKNEGHSNINTQANTWIYSFIYQFLGIKPRLD